MGIKVYIYGNLDFSSMFSGSQQKSNVRKIERLSQTQASFNTSNVNNTNLNNASTVSVNDYQPVSRVQNNNTNTNVSTKPTFAI